MTLHVSSAVSRHDWFRSEVAHVRVDRLVDAVSKFSFARHYPPLLAVATRRWTRPPIARFPAANNKHVDVDIEKKTVAGMCLYDCLSNTDIQIKSNYFMVRLKVDQRAGQLSLPHLGITKTEKIELKHKTEEQIA